MKILADYSLPNLLEAFPAPFQLTFYQHLDEVPLLLKGQDILLCRANLKITAHLLEKTSIRYVATASSGVDHVDENFLTNAGIELLDAKGCNAGAVADYVLASLAYLKKYKGFKPYKAGVIGMGMVGSRVASYLKAAQLEVICYDPPKHNLNSHFHSHSLESLYQCDLICLHPNLHYTQPHPSFHLVNEYFLNQLKPGCVIINASRGDIVDEEALLQFLAKTANKSILYCTDVFSKEPLINPKLVALSTLCTPHIAGHSLEAKQSAVALLSQKLHTLLQLPREIASELAFYGTNLQIQNHPNWEDPVLSMYNPQNETKYLKKIQQDTSSLKQAFLNLRQAHRFRHSFDFYKNLSPVAMSN